MSLAAAANRVFRPVTAKIDSAISEVISRPRNFVAQFSAVEQVALQVVGNGPDREPLTRALEALRTQTRPFGSLDSLNFAHSPMDKAKKEFQKAYDSVQDPKLRTLVSALEQITFCEVCKGQMKEADLSRRHSQIIEMLKLGRDMKLGGTLSNQLGVAVVANASNFRTMVNELESIVRRMAQGTSDENLVTQFTDALHATLPGGKVYQNFDDNLSAAVDTAQRMRESLSSPKLRIASHVLFQAAFLYRHNTQLKADQRFGAARALLDEIRKL